MVLLTHILLFVIGEDVPETEAYDAPARVSAVAARVSAGRTDDMRETLSASNLKTFAAALRYNACIHLHVCVRKRGCMVCVLFLCFMCVRAFIWLS